MLPLIVAFAVSMVGCAAPLSAKDVSASISIDQKNDVIIGDTTVVSAIGTLAHSRTDKVEVSLESSTDGVTWKPLTQLETSGPNFQIEAKDKQGAAATVTYRVTVAEPGKSSAPLSSVMSDAISVIDLSQLIRTFYYDGTNAFQISTAAGLDWLHKHNSPEIDQSAPGWAADDATDLAGNYAESLVPDLTTISPDPTWTLSVGKCNAAGVAPPKGRTFIVSVAYGYTYNGYASAPVTSDVHVTLLNGALSDYVGC
jgi:hypothetical protein